MQRAGFVLGQRHLPGRRGGARPDGDERRRPAAASKALQIDGPYHWVRHPVYLGWLLIVFGAAHLTRDRLAFATISSVYLFLAVPWEERALRQSYGQAYARYERQVKWRIIPFVY